jgi:hypothetical protein
MHTLFWLENLKGRPRRRREYNTITDLREIRWEVVDWINLAQGRDQWLALVKTVMNFCVPEKAVNSLTS